MIDWQKKIRMKQNDIFFAAIKKLENNENIISIYTEIATVARCDKICTQCGNNVIAIIYPNKEDKHDTYDTWYSCRECDAFLGYGCVKEKEN